jgi:hypothetical protein
MMAVKGRPHAMLQPRHDHLAEPPTPNYLQHDKAGRMHAATTKPCGTDHTEQHAS